jgi:hypothetical protein
MRQHPHRSRHHEERNDSITEYISKAHTLADEMVLTGKKIDDEELISYILVGLDFEYNSVVSALVARPNAISIGEAYSQLLSYEQRVERQQAGENYQASANAVSRGCDNMCGRRPAHGRSPSRGRGRHPSRGPANIGNSYGRGNSSTIGDSRPLCQVCFKGHLASECWHRFDGTYVPEERYAGAAYSAYGTDLNWYLDTGATDHMMEELEKLTMREKYKGKEQIHSVDGASMRISHIGHSIVNTPHCKLMLKNVLHVPKANKNLVSVYRLTKDNYVYLEIHPDFSFIKDHVSKKILLSGRSHRGLYPIPSPLALKQILGVFRPSLSQWHGCLGHPSYHVVAQVVNKFDLPILDESNN